MQIFHGMKFAIRISRDLPGCSIATSRLVTPPQVDTDMLNHYEEKRS